MELTTRHDEAEIENIIMHCNGMEHSKNMISINHS